MDFAEKGEHNYLNAVDSHIRWLAVIPMKTFAQIDKLIIIIIIFIQSLISNVHSLVDYITITYIYNN